MRTRALAVARQALPFCYVWHLLSTMHPGVFNDRKGKWCKERGGRTRICHDGDQGLGFFLFKTRFLAGLGWNYFLATPLSLRLADENVRTWLRHTSWGWNQCRRENREGRGASAFSVKEQRLGSDQRDPGTWARGGGQGAGHELVHLSWPQHRRLAVLGTPRWLAIKADLWRNDWLR